MYKISDVTMAEGINCTQQTVSAEKGLQKVSLQTSYLQYGEPEVIRTRSAI